MAMKEEVRRQYRIYEDTSATTCYNGASWCCKCVLGAKARISHHHLDTLVNGDLTIAEKLMANSWHENDVAYASPSNRIGHSAAHQTCASNNHRGNYVKLIALSRSCLAGIESRGEYYSAQSSG